MKLKPGFKLRPLGDEYILLAEGVETVNFNKMLTLNESAAFLYQKCEGIDFSAEKLRDFLLEEYEVTPELAEQDAKALLDSWKDAGIVE